MASEALQSQTLSGLTSKVPRAQLLNPRLRYRRYVIWGFLLDNKVIYASEPKLSPEDEKDSDEAENRFCRYVVDTFMKLKVESWRIKGVETDSQQVASRVVRVGKGLTRNAIALVQCTHRDDSFIPSSEKVEELKKYFANLGHLEEPGWFIVRQNF